ncbi:MAG: hypothetical protein K8S54_19740 [Spirochaetia bacterium]|nr:hypothetical protein [Spirochaetia bacterium]
MLQPEFDSWPILQFEEKSTSFLSHGECIRIPTICTFPISRFAILEQAELDLALGRPPIDLVWNPPERLQDLLTLVFETARAAGGLRISSSVGCPPIEAVCTNDQIWCETFPILHLSNLTMPDWPSSERPTESHTLVYFNPAGDPLPFARKEAEGLCKSQAQNVRGIFRTVSEEELASEIRAADRIIYLGHAKNVAGRPAIPGLDGFIPLIPREAGSVARKSFLLLACLEATAELVVPGGYFVHPICKIADRRTDFSARLAADWQPSAILDACKADAQARDIRRFIYRAQGSISF